jgi:2-polyprenyl-3-methyl-5-hydroxy-6-metoxy-1,4-benzoquinol methylase
LKRTNNPNINQAWYWNSIYKGDARQQYATQGTDLAKAKGHYIKPTARFGATLQEVNNGDVCLDIGCGVGVLTNLIKNTYPNCEVWGVDISDQAIRDNIKENPSITYHKQEIGNLNKVPSNHFDFVFSGETLEHLDHPEDLIKDACMALKPGGKLVITTPEGHNIPSEEHVYEFSHEDVEKLMKDNGFDNVRFIYLPKLEHLLVIMAVGVKK